MPNVIELADRFDRALASRDKKALTRIIHTYVDMRNDLQDRIDALLLHAKEKELTRTQLYHDARYKALLAQTERELDKFQSWLGTELKQSARSEIGTALHDAEALVNAAIDPTGRTTLEGTFNRLHTKAVERMLGFLDKDGPLYARLEQLAPTTADKVGKTLLDAIGKGWNPRVTAKMITRSIGMGLSDALRMTRTVQIYSYREASRATYIENSDVVAGWYWYAHLAGACLSCIAQHGSFHPITERLNDHHNGKCTPIPAVRGFDNPIDKMGDAWFGELSQKQQLELMGKGRYDAWKAGQFLFGDLTRERADDVYGPMKSEATLWELLGTEPPTRK